MPEINYYTYSAAIPEDEFEETLANNLIVSNEFALEIARDPEMHGCFEVDGGTVQAAAYEILSFHHDYPQYEVEPYSGIMSSAALKLLGRAAAGLAVHISGMELPQRRNFIAAESLKSMPSLKKILEILDGKGRERFFDAINLKLLNYMITGFQRGDERLWFKRIPATFYTFQEKAHYRGSRKGRLVKMLSLEDLLEEENRCVIAEFPEIAEKLTVFFVLVYRYFLDTGFIADLRPDDAGRDLFLKGIWGYKTPNVLIMIFEREDGTRFTEIKFVDNKDQFKQYRRGEDRQMPLGLAKYGLRLAYPLIQPAMERSIGIFTNAACEKASGSKPRTEEEHIAAEQALKFTGAVLREGVDSSVVHTQAFLHDLIDDVTEGTINIIKKF
ncbi:MAG: hypothetical protein FJ088_06505 [Deltaproteobacteria bacterium]|nr:hypothetical protein [Deltaproteobacteria bacterium]